MDEQLTSQQKMAVLNRGGSLLVSAAAGSGKTKVLVDRLMSYLTDPADPANIDDFLIITYTKAAASELRGKISDKLTQYIAENPENRHLQQQIQRLYLAKISTVHAFCGDLLREFAYRMDISADFRIAEESECQEMMYGVLQQLLEESYAERLDDPSFRAFIDSQGFGRDDRQIPEIILQIYSSALCHLDPNGWLDDCLIASKVVDIQDVSETTWGSYLLQDFRNYLSMQIQTLEDAVAEAQDVPGMEKPAQLLGSTICGLRSLLACKTWDEIVTHPPVNYGTLTFKKEHKGSQLAESIKAVRNHCKEQLPKKLRYFTQDSQTILKQLRETSSAVDGLVALVQEFRIRYDKVKKARRVLDFADIEQKTLDLLLGKGRTGATSTADEIGLRYREIMVDEYQDSNEVQDAIFGTLTRVRHNIFMVGDVKQSIYQFRLADPEIFLNKYNHFLPAETATPGQNRKVLLSRNFRSSAGVISAVNDVFTNCMSASVGGLEYGVNEQLYEGIPHVALPDNEVELYGIDVREDTYAEEAAFVAQRICELLNGNHCVRSGDILRPITAEDIVILLRSPGSVGGEFRYALEQAGIACTMGGDLDLLQTPEVDTLHSILQIIYNPLQDIPLIAALSSPVFGFTADNLSKIRAKHKKSPFYTALTHFGSTQCNDFLSLLNQLRKDARFLSITQLIQQIFHLTGMLSIYGAMNDGEVRIRNLQGFCQIAADFENTGRKDLSYFLDHLAATAERGLSVADSVPANAVRIMSIHKSKGLEFPVVFLCGLSRGFNMMDTQKQVLCHKDLGIGLTCYNPVQRVRFPTIAKRAIAAKITEESISEELRVLYVAMTRARDRLIMTYAGSKLADRLQDLALRMDLSHRELLNRYVSCPGNWVLMSALKRTEAGQFFHLSGCNTRSSVQQHPWLIRVVDAPQQVISQSAVQMQEADIPTDVLDKMRRGLAFMYPNSNAVSIPSKLTATQLKGRLKDQEAAEFANVPNERLYRFLHPLTATTSGTDYGNALHTFMQYVDFSRCGSLEQLEEEVCRIYESKLITQQQMEQIPLTQIADFFQTNIGKKLRSGVEVIREFKFSLLEDAKSFYEDVIEDHVLLQGIIDCALLEEDGIILLDFKTDVITDQNLQGKIAQYSNQVKTYAMALSRIYERPVKEAYLYFFRTGQFFAVQ